MFTPKLYAQIFDHEKRAAGPPRPILAKGGSKALDAFPIEGLSADPTPHYGTFTCYRRLKALDGGGRAWAPPDLIPSALTNHALGQSTD